MQTRVALRLEGERCQIRKRTLLGNMPSPDDNKAPRYCIAFTTSTSVACPLPGKGISGHLVSFRDTDCDYQLLLGIVSHLQPDHPSSVDSLEPEAAAQTVLLLLGIEGERWRVA